MSYTFEQMVDDWKVDCTVNETNISNEITRTPQLHSKYLRIYMHAKAKLTGAEKRFNTMKWRRRSYYKGELTKEQLDEYGWSQYQGLKLSATEFSSVADIDPELVPLDEKISYYKSFVSGAEFILKQIGQRDYSLKTLLEHQKFVAGA